MYLNYSFFYWRQTKQNGENSRNNTKLSHVDNSNSQSESGHPTAVESSHQEQLDEQTPKRENPTNPHTTNTRTIPAHTNMSKKQLNGNLSNKL